MQETSTYIWKPALEKQLQYLNEGDRQVSFSQYSKYFKCPKSWKLTYIDKIRESQESIDLVFGQAMHSTIQEWIKVMYTTTIKKSNEMNLNDLLLTNLKHEYSIRKEKHGSHFSSPEEISSYYAEGVSILNTLKKKRNIYFSTKQMKLVAIELPLTSQIHEDYPTIKLKGFLDLVFYNEYTKKYIILDIKTSVRGWNDYKKKDPMTTDQLLIYKIYLAKLLKVEVDSIDVKFFIVKRKIDENSLWPQRRIQEFVPSNGKVSLNRVNKNLNKFVEECFNMDGTYKTDKIYPALAGVNYKNCMFCMYSNMEEICPKAKRICSND